MSRPFGQIGDESEKQCVHALLNTLKYPFQSAEVNATIPYAVHFSISCPPSIETFLGYVHWSNNSSVSVHLSKYEPFERRSRMDKAFRLY